MGNHKLTTPRRFKAFPSHQLGWWGLGLTLAFVALFALKVANLPVPMPVPSFVIFGVGLVGLALNLLAFLRGDRSWVLLVFGGLIGAFILVWIFGELAFPH
jgi:hypothetical protein